MEGKLYLCNVSRLNKIPDNTIKLFIARQPIKDMNKYNLKHVIELAPSYNLLRDIKKNKISWEDYVVRYKQEMVLMKPTIQKIYNYVKKNNNIAIMCYCNDSNRCHRGIIGDYLSNYIEVIDIK